MYCRSVECGESWVLLLKLTPKPCEYRILQIVAHYNETESLAKVSSWCALCSVSCLLEVLFRACKRKVKELTAPRLWVCLLGAYHPKIVFAEVRPRRGGGVGVISDFPFLSLPTSNPIANPVKSACEIHAGSEHFSSASNCLC